MRGDRGVEACLEDITFWLQGIAESQEKLVRLQEEYMEVVIRIEARLEGDGNGSESQV